jgi:hypothetical protein
MCDCTADGIGRLDNVTVLKFTCRRGHAGETERGTWKA